MHKLKWGMTATASVSLDEPQKTEKGFCLEV